MTAETINKEADEPSFVCNRADSTRNAPGHPTARRIALLIFSHFPLFYMGNGTLRIDLQRNLGNAEIFHTLYAKRRITKLDDFALIRWSP
jgi:hypothetical protein